VGLRYDGAYGYARMTSWFVAIGGNKRIDLIDVVVLFDDGTLPLAVASQALKPTQEMLDLAFGYASSVIRQVTLLVMPNDNVMAAQNLAHEFQRKYRRPVNIFDVTTLTTAREHSVQSLAEALARRVDVHPGDLQPFVTTNRKLVIDYLIEANLHRVPNAGRFTLYVPDPRASPFTRTLSVTDFFARLAPSSSPRMTESPDAPRSRVTSLGTLHPRLAVPADVAECLSVTDTDPAASSSLPINRTTVIACIAAALMALPTSANDAFFYDNQVVRWASNTRVLEPWASLPCAHGSFRYYYAVAAIKQLLDEPSLGADALRQVVSVQDRAPAASPTSTQRQLLTTSRRSRLARDRGWVMEEMARRNPDKSQPPQQPPQGRAPKPAAAPSPLEGRPKRIDPLYTRMREAAEAGSELEYAKPKVIPVGNYTFDPSDLPAPTRMFVRYRRSTGRGLLQRLTSPPHGESGLYHDFDAVGLQEVQEDGAYGPVQWHENRFLDVVITHVDLQAPGFEKLLQHWQAVYQINSDSASANRYRNFDELKFNIESLRHNAGRLVRKIFVVVNSVEHVPTWLVPTDDLKIITHKDIFTPEWKAVEHPYLPTFNSLVIESFLHRIPGLSPFFVYANNDQFIGRRLSVWDLFRPKAESRPRRFLPNDDIWEDSDRNELETVEVEPVLYGESSMHPPRELRCTLQKDSESDAAPQLYCPARDDMFYIFQSIQHSTNMMWKKYRTYTSRFFAHIPTVFDRRLLTAMIDAFEPDFDRSRRHRFRHEENLFIQHMYLHYSVAVRNKPFLATMRRVEAECGVDAREMMYSPSCPSRAAVDLHTPIGWLLPRTAMPPLPEVRLGSQGDPALASTEALCAAARAGRLCAETTNHVASGLWSNLSATGADHPSGLPPPYQYILHEDAARLSVKHLKNPSLELWQRNGAGAKLWGGISDMPAGSYLFMDVTDSRTARDAKELMRKARAETGGFAFICLNDNVVETPRNLRAAALLFEIAANLPERFKREIELDHLALFPEEAL
jgi:hypothetical protein